MKNLRKLLASLIAIVCLAGCTISGGKGSSSHSSSAPSTSITSSAEGSSSASSSLTSAIPSSSSSSYSSSSSSSTSEEPPAVVVHSVEEIISDIESSLGITLNVGSGYYTSYSEGDYTLVESPDTTTYVDNASEDLLAYIAEYVAEYLPEYLVSADSWYYNGIISEEMSDEEKEEHDYWGDEDGSTAYEAYFVNEDQSALVSVLSYCYYGYPFFRVIVYSYSLVE